jgi:hypothetical protein
MSALLFLIVQVNLIDRIRALHTNRSGRRERWIRAKISISASRRT